jgi:hypothetical protein
MLRIEQVAGDLQIQGWLEPRLQLESDDGEFELDLSALPLRLRCADDAALRLPVNATVEILNVDGDLQVADLSGVLTLGVIHGDVHLREIGPLVVTVVHGELSAQAVEGDCHLRRVHDETTLTRVRGNIAIDNVGDDCTINDVTGNVAVNAGDECVIRNVQGNVIVQAGDEASVSHVQGDVVVSAGGELDLRHIEGKLQANAGGDATLRLSPQAGCEYHVNSGGDIACRLAPGSNTEVSLHAGGVITFRKLEGIPVGSEQVSRQNARFTLGSGGATLQLSAGGDLVLTEQSSEKEQEFEFKFNFGGKSGPEIAAAASDISRQILGQMEIGLRSMARKLDERLSNLGNSDEFAGRVQEKVQTAMRKAEEKMAEAMREAERRGREAEARMAEWESRQPPRRGFVRYGAPPPPRPPKAKAAASEEERLMVLRMVSEGKISVEQAEQLLAALGGAGD